MSHREAPHHFLEPPPEFQGLHPEKPIRIYYGDLPHWRQEGATYFVTFRLADSLPQQCLVEIAAIRRQWELAHPEPRDESAWLDYGRQVGMKQEEWLDKGCGSCALNRQDCAELVADAMKFFDGQRYHLGAFVVMPNHVHVIFRPLGDQTIEDIMMSWKGFTARKVNQLLNRTGQFWQRESYDTIVRDCGHLAKAVAYIGANAAKAGLKPENHPRWVRPDWEKAGYGFV
ncbi:MAG: transposase [Verrucomicrobia bacterium]|nr:transposase [Verrucomicrobiota bacterium]